VAFRAATLSALLALVAILASCDTGHSIVADNQTPDDVLARIRGTSYPRTSVATYEPFSYLVIVPAKTRLVIAIQPFVGDRVNAIEILSSECQKIAEFVHLELGAVFVIRDGPSTEQFDEFPTGSPTAEQTNVCAE
jgi:hypothetical protein